MKAVAIVSGGMDSTVLAYDLRYTGHSLHLLSFNYGQRHKKELDYARITAAKLGAKWDLIDLMPIGHLLSGSALTSPGEVEVPEGHYAAESMAATVVPNRNQIMLSIALGVAHASGAEVVATAVHAGDHEIYWDCRPDFIQAMDNIARQAIESGYGHANIVAPYVNQTKAQIASWGAQLGVPFEDTWSCYKGGDYHCGRCGTCIERIEAFHIAGVKDPTVYQDMTMYLELRGKGKVR